MRCKASYQELEVLGECLAYDYMKKLGRLKSVAFDIEGFITDYLGLTIVYENIVEEDRTKIGFVSDGKTPIMIYRNNDLSAVIFPKNTIVIDRYLLRQSESSRKRFILAHEAAHVILDRHLSQQSDPHYKSEFDKDADYSFEDEMRMFSIDEALTDRLAAVVLMPGFQVRKVLKKHNSEQTIKCFEGYVFLPEYKVKIQKMADDLGVSYSAMINRLRELNLIETYPMCDYLAELRKAVH